MPDRPLPSWPRGLPEDLAAAYVGLSVSTFRTQVTAGDAPAATWLTPGRKVWLREHLDAWLDRKAGTAAPSSPVNEWDALCADGQRHAAVSSAL